MNMFNTSVNRNGLLRIMLVSSVLSMVLLSFRMYITGSPAYIFLAWNLFLAWVPFICSLCIKEVGIYRYKKAIRLFLFLVWLVFFPNSPYIITDLYHLHPRPGMPLWFDLFLIISFAWNGLMLGFTSLILVQQWISVNFSKWLNWTMVTGLMFTCGYGVYLGRFERWNSWDILSHGDSIFLRVFHHITDPFGNMRMLGVTLIYGTFLLLGYLTLLALMNLNKNDTEGSRNV
jgi:uncharacterized membrane protein